MFTGLIEDVGRLERLTQGADGAELFIRTRLVADGDVALGDSICVDGCCLTATAVDDTGFAAQASTETLSRTTLGAAAPGQDVNLERALAAGGRLGGHIVQGHVDGVGAIDDIQPDGAARIVRFSAPPELLAYLAEKGSVAVDGISLTVNAVETGTFTVTLIPHTLAATTLGARQPGDRVNLETDVIAKYVVSYLRTLTSSGGSSKSGIDLGFLARHGFATDE